MKKLKPLIVLPLLFLVSCQGFAETLLDMYSLPPGVYAPGCVYQSPHQHFYWANGRHYNMRDPEQAADYWYGR